MWYIIFRISKPLRKGGFILICNQKKVNSLFNSVGNFAQLLEEGILVCLHFNHAKWLIFNSVYGFHTPNSGDHGPPAYHLKGEKQKKKRKVRSMSQFCRPI